MIPGFNVGDTGFDPGMGVGLGNEGFRASLRASGKVRDPVAVGWNGVLCRL